VSAAAGAAPEVRVTPLSASSLARAGLLLVVALGGCAAPRVKPDADLLARQSAREHALAAEPSWQLSGRLGVSDGHDGGSGSLQWRQDRDAFRFSVHAPVTGKTWVLEREVGWHVPVAELTSWARAARAEGDAQIEFRSDGLPAVILQDGWKIEYPDYDSTHEPPLPRKIFASRGDYRVRLSVNQWQ